MGVKGLLPDLVSPWPLVWPLCLSLPLSDVCSSQSGTHALHCACPRLAGLGATIDAA